MSSASNRRPIVIAGGSGFLGTSLARHFSELGWPVRILSRSVPEQSGPVEHVSWDARTPGQWMKALDGTSGLINLVGRSVDCIKTPDRCDEILRSRVEATHVLGRAVRSVDTPPPVWVQMSTAHIYGDPPEAICTENSPYGHGLAPFVGKAWEESFAAAALPSQRKVVLRTSFVIGRGGGALARLKTLVRWGLGGTVGSGRQGMCWLHQADMNSLMTRALIEDSMHGVYIASSPRPVSQREFMQVLRKVMEMPIGLPAPAWLVRLGAPLIMRTDPELALYGRYVIPQRLQEEGFEFRFPDLEDALRDLLRPSRSGSISEEELVRHQ